MNNPEAQWFGERAVKPDEKTSLVEGVFGSVADKYDIMNDVMSGGIHRLWKDRLIRLIQPRKNWHFLDVAGGTGDIAFRINERTDGKAPITICDLTANMLSVGRDRAIDKGYSNNPLNFVCGNAESLPIPDNSVDIYTIAFGLRNVTHIDTALNEAWRVLKPGGRFFCLEFSKVIDPNLDKFYQIYSRTLIPRMGEIIAKDSESYQYLIESIRKFPSQNKLAARMKEAKFDKVNYKNLSLGIAAIHYGTKKT